MLRPEPAAVPIRYPSSDGKPRAKNDAQRDAITYGIGAPTRHFRDRPDVYVSGDLVTYEEGNPRVSIAPDVIVVFGVEDRLRPEHRPARLQGEHLTPSGYVQQPEATAADGTLALYSETLDLELLAAPGREMRFRDPATGHDLRSHDEEADARPAAETRAAVAKKRAASEARSAELAALLHRRPV